MSCTYNHYRKDNHYRKNSHAGNDDHYQNDNHNKYGPHVSHTPPNHTPINMIDPFIPPHKTGPPAMIWGYCVYIVECDVGLGHFGFYGREIGFAMQILKTHFDDTTL